MKQSIDWKECYHELYNNAPCGYFTASADGTILQINNTLLDLLHYHRDEILGKIKWQDLLTVGSKMYYETHFHPLLLMQGKVKEISFECYRKDRLIVPVLVNTTLIRDDQTKPVSMRSTVFDYTDRKKYEAELLRAKRQAEELTNELVRTNKELEQFVYIASHDLQEPLRTVRNYLEILQEEHGPALEEEAKLYMGVIDGAVSRMQELIHALLGYSRLHGMREELKMVNVEHLIKDVLETLTISIGEKNATIVTEKLPVLPVFETAFRQLWQNLISNALKFSRSGYPPLIKISAQQKPNHWQFSITDNGIGIDSVHQTKIFEIFRRLHTSESYEGTGIGLAFCKKIVTLHRGKIWVQSKPGQGSTFFFTIPKQAEP